MTVLVLLSLSTQPVLWTPSVSVVGWECAFTLCACCSCRYEYYYALLRDFPDLQFTINGGINTIDEVNFNFLPVNFQIVLMLQHTFERDSGYGFRIPSVWKLMSMGIVCKEC